MFKSHMLEFFGAVEVFFRNQQKMRIEMLRTYVKFSACEFQSETISSICSMMSVPKQPPLKLKSVCVSLAWPHRSTNNVYPD